MNGILNLRTKGWCIAGLLLACHVASEAAPRGRPARAGGMEPQAAVATTTQVVSNLNPSYPGQAVTFTATVNSSTPTGTVIFKQSNVYATSATASSKAPGAAAYAQDSIVIAGCEAVPVSGTAAQCTFVFDATGNWEISAEYSGDTTNASSAGMLAGGQTVRAEWPMLKVRKLGSGFIVGPGVGCGSDCREYYPPGATVTLTANPNDHVGFKSWHGCNTAQGKDCVVNVYSDRTVTAEFESDAVPANDFNDDGRSDIVWRNSVNAGESVLWLMNGPDAPTVASLATNPAYRVTNAGDFNGDGKTDLVWLDTTTGEVSIALMNDATVISRTVLLPPGAGYTVKQIGDFNGGGKSDLLWHGTDGATVIWLMDGPTGVTQQAITQAGTGWVPVLVGDFNDDGRTDILWQDAFGATAIWLMEGANVQSGAMILPPGSGYVAQHLGDFDGDGRADIVFKGTDGRYDLWMMKGYEVIRAGTILNGGTGMNVTHVADFDGEGRSDLVFEGTDGTVAIWQMDALTVARTTTFQSLGRTVKLARDYTGDGKADLLWAYSDGSYVLWTMDGGAVMDTATLRQPGNTFQAVP